jgi:hypothetical protein
MRQEARDDGFGLGAQIAACCVSALLVGVAAVFCWIGLALFGVVGF